MAAVFVEVEEATERIEAEVCTLAGQIAAATCRFILLIAELDRRESWREWGCNSMAHWLNWKCGLGLVAAREHIRVGRALEDLSAFRQAFAEGRLSYSKVRAVTRVATPEREGELIEFALAATAAQLERTVRGFQKTRSDTETEQDRLDQRRFRFYSRSDGTSELEAIMTDELRELLALALDKALKEVPYVDGDSAEARRLDALEVIVREFLAGRDDRVPTEVVVNVDAGDLTEDELSPYVERMLCDTSVRVDVRQGDKHVVGKRKRTIPRALRRAIMRRDKGVCRFPGCTNTRLVAVHHMDHFVRGGPTNTENCMLLCTFHHRLVHDGGWGACGDGDGRIVFVSPIGRRVSDDDPPRTPARLPFTTGIDEDTIATALGERLDVHYAAQVLQRIPPSFN